MRAKATVREAGYNQQEAHKCSDSYKNKTKQDKDTLFLIMCMCEDALGGQKVSGLLELKFQAVVSEPCNMGIGNQIQVL